MYRIGTFYWQLAAGIKQDGLRDIDEAFAVGRELGIVDLDISFKEITDETPAILARTGMKASSVHALIPCAFETRDAYLASLDEMKKAINKAVSVESTYFMPVPQIPAKTPEEKLPEARAAIRELFSDLCEYAKQLPITVTVEDFSVKKTPYASIEDIKYLLDNNPTLMFTYDSGNFPLAGVDEIEGLKAFLDRTVYVHLKDLEKSPRGEIIREGIKYDSLELGGGYLKNLEALKILKASGFENGTVIAEVNSSFDSFKRTVASVNWLKEAFKAL